MTDHESPQAWPHWHECCGRSASGRHLLSAAPPPELVIVDLVAQHNEQPHEELAGDGDFGFRASTSMHEREVGPLEIGIHAGGMRGGLPESEAEQRAALLGDVAEVI